MRTWEQAMSNARFALARAEQTEDLGAARRNTTIAKAWVDLANAITYRDHLNRPQPDPDPGPPPGQDGR